MQRPVNRGGTAIELGTNGGSADSRDRDVTPYEA
jgi:hypothetical protein